MSRSLVIYHRNCYDGFGAAYAAWLALGDDADYLPMYHDEQPPLVIGREVYVLDFSFKRPVLEALKAGAKKFVVIDHHKTAQEDLAGVPDCIFDMNRSGAALAWEYFHPGTKVPEMIAYIEDSDLWRFALPESREVRAAMKTFPFDFSAWMSIHLGGMEPLKLKGRALVEYNARQVSSMTKDARLVRVVEDYVIPVANATVSYSEVGEALCKAYPAAPFSLYWFQRSDGKYQYGLRSQNGFDTSAIAKRFGGGGHAAASGFQLPYLLPAIASGEAA